MRLGFYKELEELRADGMPDASFGFLENVPVGDSYYLYDFLHGCCDQFAAALSDFFGYEIEYVIGNDDNLIHAYCVRDFPDGETAYIDARGITTDVELFLDEFRDWCDYDVRSGDLCDLGGECQVMRHKDTKEMYPDENRELNQDKDLYQFLKDYRDYYNVNVFQRSKRNMIKNNVEYRVKGYTNKWALIDTLDHYGLLENSTYGDETCYLVADLNQEPEMRRYKRTDESFVELPTIMEVLGETYDGLEIALDDLGIEFSEKVEDVIASASERRVKAEQDSAGVRARELDGGEDFCK